jgi:hypothetical protein
MESDAAVSTHDLPDGYDRRLAELIYRHVRPPLLVSESSVEFDPDLNPEEEAKLAKVVSLSRSGLEVTDAEWDALSSDIDGLRTYHGLATPTAAQTAQATKAIIRVLRAVLRD